MADTTFDVVLIGGGTKCLFLGIYLAKYGGLSVGMFEARHELGGGLGSHEAPAPGFIGDTHASTLQEWYYEPVRWDFPDFEEKGGKLSHYPVTVGIIPETGDRFWGIYHHTVDPNQEKTAAELTRFSGEKDAETYLKLHQAAVKEGGLHHAYKQTQFSLPPPPGEPTAVQIALKKYLAEPDCLVDERWLVLPGFQGVRELFENEAVAYLYVRFGVAAGRHPDMVGSTYAIFGGSPLLGYAVGGTHSVAHACQRIFLEHGGKFFTKHEVEKIVIENGRARGVRLVNGAEIAARKFVVSGVDPYQLCFRLIGSDHLNPRILKKVEGLERSLTCITWYTWAVHQLPRYKAAAFNPDANNTHWMILGSDYEYLTKEANYRRLGLHHPKPLLAVFGQHSQFDRTRAPEGKDVVSIEDTCVNATVLSEKEWMEFKKTHAQLQIEGIQKYAPNMNWENVIGYDPITPYDVANRQKNMWPTGNFDIIDRIPGQMPPYAPIPELARHRTPVQNLYATGAAWGSLASGSCIQGYTCYKAIAEDLGLRKPWEEQGRPY